MDLTAKNNPLEDTSTVIKADGERTVLIQGAASGAMTAKVKKDTKRILVVDDDEDIVKLVKMYLEHHRYEVITANDGQQGLEKAKTEKPDLIVLDLMMPKIDGYKVCELLKKDARYAKTPVILLTAKTQGKDIEAGQEVGADAYLIKPFEPEILLAKIKKLLKE